MALFLVLEDFAAGTSTASAGSILDSTAVDLAPLQAAGLAVVAYNPATMSASRAAFLAARGSRPSAPDTSGDLSALLLAAGAFNDGGITELTGDVLSGPGSGTQNASVVALQGAPVSAIAPADGQVLVWNGAEWVPGTQAAGGSGGGGQVYYMNAGTGGAAPVVGLPGTPLQLGLVAEVPLSTIASSPLPSNGTWALVAGFVTDTLTPGVLVLPAGLWDFNVWASASAPQPNTTLFRVKVYTYDGATATLIATGSATPLFDPTQTVQYACSVLLPQTPLLATDRIYVELEARGTSPNHVITFSFGDNAPTHVHTTLSSIAGTGLVHVVNGVIQSPATPVDLAGGATEITGTLPVANGGTGTAGPPVDGQILIGRTATSDFALATLTAGSGISITNGAGSVSLAATAKSVWHPDVEPISDPTYVAAASYQRGGTNPFTQWNPGSVPSPYSTVPFGLRLAAPASSNTIFGYTLALPAVAGSSEFSMTMRWSFEGAPVSGAGTLFGVLVGRDLIANPATGGHLAATVNYSTSPASTGNAVFLFNQNNYTSFGTTLKTYVFSTLPGGLPGAYAEYAYAAPGSMIRFSVDKTHANYSFAISDDGVAWFEIQGPRALAADIPGAGAINTIGIIAYNASTLSRQFWVPWYRYREGASGVYRNYSPEGGLT